ncbi:hypothetical protein DRJ16_05940 [Candidatus Woesearchaeota archaeon]|nr:MAG: hypothetical protein DRJ16_05940 [Candidatus Woesearchaeota archaeon]
MSLLEQAEQILRDNYDKRIESSEIYLESINEIHGVKVISITSTYHWTGFQASVINDVMNKDILAKDSMRQQAHNWDLHLPEYFYTQADTRVLLFMDEMTEKMSNGDRTTATICDKYIDK